MKTIIVTGGNRGIGLEICRQLDTKGHRVILGSRSLEKGVEAAKDLSDNVIVKQLDVTIDDSVHAFYEFVKTGYGKLDGLINNAGIGENYDITPRGTDIKKTIKTSFPHIYDLAKKIKPILNKAGISKKEAGASDTSLAHVKHIMETNFYGAWRMIQYFIPLLEESGDGRIINISSGMGELQSLNGLYPGYSLSKTSMNALTIMFSNELKNKGISVNAICPGWVKTDMGGPDAPRLVSEGADTAVWLATAEDIATGDFYRDREIISW